ncbi:MAG: hypothetical protein CSYNP_02012 [Syntrophus sp. SKADARSKE-3]|nr:hypothetical protein [Syntrophus sp. SKADARSKE-3]
MKKLMSIVVSILFALSLSGLAFAQAAPEKPAGDTVKAEQKAPAKEKKAKKTKKTKKAKKAKKAEKADEAAPAPDKK